MSQNNQNIILVIRKNYHLAASYVLLGYLLYITYYNIKGTKPRGENITKPAVVYTFVRRL